MLAEKVYENACAEFHENQTKDSRCYHVTNSLTDGCGLHGRFSVGTYNRLDGRCERGWE